MIRPTDMQIITWDEVLRDRPDLRALERLIMRRAEAERGQTGPWCIDVMWQMEIEPVLRTLLPEECDYVWGDHMFKYALATTANCRQCGFQHSTAWEKETGQ